jgi:hypothetical protein
MLKIDTMDEPRGVTMLVAAPLTALDYQIAHVQITSIPDDRWTRLLLEVDSIAIAEPSVLWEDLKLAPLVRHMRSIAVVTDVDWFSRFAVLAGAVWPGLRISHFEPFDQDAALQWLKSFPS